MIYKLYCTTIPVGAANAVMATTDDGETISFILGTDNPNEKAYLKWLEEGNTPEPADE